ncbi:MAG: hypothetical protein KAT65_19235, partial [Methanophagales archaeon]|nr:hypothetical protein [Methanophagales archaeon]
TDLIPSESISFSDVWGTSEAEEGSYNIVGYVLYDSKATEPVTVTISSRVIPTNRIYPDPQHSLASFCSTADVEIWISATDTFQSGQIKLVYDSDCANVTNWARNTATFPMGFWTHTDGQEWIGFTATTALTGEYLIGTLTIHCVNDSPAGCTTPLDFVDPSALFDLSGNEITANWVDGTFEC